MTAFKPGDLVIPKDEYQQVEILRQSEGLLPFPCRVIDVEGDGIHEFLRFKKTDGEIVGLYASRFKHHTFNKPLEDYL